MGACDVRVTSEVEVPLKTLDQVATDCQWPKIDLIKLDVEGMEFAALCGAEALVAKDRPVILFEGEPESLALRGAGLSETILWLRQRGYAVMDFSAPDGSPDVLGERDPVTVNLLAVPVEGTAETCAARNGQGANQSMLKRESQSRKSSNQLGTAAPVAPATPAGLFCPAGDPAPKP